ncbi:recombinase family protein [Halosaccharopolyspora lacisalsi]|uniref:recombinase family protein n=1 Tax=Halosaccharopolyspora lacisalsi TaxID=1000566 RepID=UPI001C71D7D1|nr:recombinase family protein [Halosaccharopolyspora lacisalsi]
MSTEDQQDPETSRNWQRTRAQALIEAHGQIVVEYFDIGHSRSLPWKRRSEATRLLDALKDPDRGFDAVVIGEPQRAFYGNQYSLTFPVFDHYGVGLWVPEVGGPIDPGSEAHDLIMGVFGGMSKGERNRIKVRVRTAMQSQARLEGRYLGGRPPYGYRLVDAGPHPNPGKAADGKRLHTLTPDPDTAPVVQRIFAEYLAGAGLFAIAEGLTRDGILSPSAHDRARNPHRSTTAWSKGAVRTILTNPRYTGHQVWNKQYKRESLIDVDDVALAHTKAHPANVYLREIDVLPHLDGWLASAFAPERLDDTLSHLRAAAQHENSRESEAIATARATQQDCQRKLAQYRQALDEGVSPATVASWIADVEAEQARAQATLRDAQAPRSHNPDIIAQLFDNCHELARHLHRAAPEHEAPVYQALGVQITYNKETPTAKAQVNPQPSDVGIPSCRRG